MLVVDYTGLAIRVCGAEKVSNVGLFWGYNIFGGQAIKVKFREEGELFQIEIQEVKDVLCNILNVDDEIWDAGGTRDLFIKRLKSAKKISDIIDSYDELFP